MAPGPRCKTTPARSFNIGERGTAPAESGADGGDADDDGQELALPFAVEIGSAVATARGFAVAGLRSMAGGSGAFVALIDGQAGSGRVVELGRTYGGADPPRLAARGDRLVVVVPDSDAGSGRLRLASIAGNASPSTVTWGAEVATTRDESAAFSVELGEKRGIVVWDEVDKKSQRGMIRVSAFDAADIANATQPRTISPETSDADAPRLAARPGGFWLAWTTRAVAAARPEKNPRAKPPSAGGAKAAGDAGADESVLRVGVRGLLVVPLDGNGSPTGEPRAVTAPRAHVVAFDVGSAPDGALFVAWRDDDTAPGVESGAVHVAHIALDGSITRALIEDEHGGAGVPSLVVDRQKSSRAAHPVWLALASVTDATRLGALGGSGELLDSLAGDPLLSNAEPLALRDGRLLLGRPRGMAVELNVIDCVPGAPPAAAPSATKDGG